MKSLNQGESAKRYFRCDDDLWLQFINKCGSRKWSQVLRELIQVYINSL